MLRHSFSFLPVRLGKSWWLISELGLAKFLNLGGKEKAARLGMTIQAAKTAGMEAVKISGPHLLRATMTIEDVLKRAQVKNGPMLWLVIDEEHADHLAGVLSPFELM